MECQSELFFASLDSYLSGLGYLRRPGAKGCDSNEVSLSLWCYFISSPHFPSPTPPPFLPLVLSRVRGAETFLDSTVSCLAG